MNNYSLVILLWIACSSIAFATTNTIAPHNVEPIAVLHTNEVVPDLNIQFSIAEYGSNISIKNTSPIKQLRIYDGTGKLLETHDYLGKDFNYNADGLKAGKYAFIIQVGDHVETHVYNNM
jgi:hypothetical protein